MEDVVIGLDIGTSSIKLVLYGERGVFYQDRLEHSDLLSNGKEIDPCSLFHDIKSIIQKSVHLNPFAKIKAIGLSTFFPSFIAVDENNAPLTNIITWMDPRGDDIIAHWRNNNDNFFKKIRESTGCVTHESYTLWKILWFKENNPILFSKTKKFLNLPAYLCFQFTGKSLLSYANASTTSLFNIHSIEWDHDILNFIGLTNGQLPECASVFHAEKMFDSVCDEMGLNEGVVLILGVGDGHASNIGSGCMDDRYLCSSMGTSSALRIVKNSPITNDSVWSHYLYDNLYISGIATNAGINSISWFFQKIVKEDNNIDIYLKGISKEKKSKIIFLPFLNGERGPKYQPYMKCSVFGLDSETTRDDILISICEGTFFNLYECYFHLFSSNSSAQNIIATGGYVNSKFLLQMQSDIFNHVIIPVYHEASAFGAALLAARTMKNGKSFSLSYNVNRDIIYPNEKKQQYYREKFKIYTTFSDYMHKSM